MITPREMLRDYMTLLNILLQNEDATFASVVEKTVTLKTDEDEKQPTVSTTVTVNTKEESESAPARPLFDPNDIDF